VGVRRHYTKMLSDFSAFSGFFVSSIMLGILVEIILNVLIFASTPRHKTSVVLIITGVVLGLAAVTIARSVSI